MLLKTLSQSRFLSVAQADVLEPHCLVRLTQWCHCISVVPKATRQTFKGPKPGQENYLEERKRTIPSISIVESLICPLGKSRIIYTTTYTRLIFWPLGKILKVKKLKTQEKIKLKHKTPFFGIFKKMCE